jgi:hypothetical protein
VSIHFFFGGGTVPSFKNEQFYWIRMDSYSRNLSWTITANKMDNLSKQWKVKGKD